jgi:phosphatidylglycerophosphate synthase
MDVPLYAIALIVFSLLYLALAVVFTIALAITLIVLFLYLAIRYGKMPDNYPHGFGDALITAIFIGVTWGIFTLLGPHNPIPFLPNGSATYQTSTVLSVNEILAVALILAVIFLFIGSFIARYLRDGSGTGSSTTTTAQSDSKPKQGVGA